MQAVGVIAEFNPFHKGHAYVLRTARAQSGADAVVVVMAGNFVQRGETAIVDKWARARMALANGADLVVELPITAAIQSAELFAQGGVQQLDAIGVQTLAFGSEQPALDYRGLATQRLALEAAKPDTAFSDFRQTYASQLATYYAQLTGSPITAPNTMLGLAYAEAAVAAKSPLRLLPIQRIGGAHDSQDGDAGNFASGSVIREQLLTGQDVQSWVPAATASLLTNTHHFTWADFWPLLRYRLQTASLDELRSIDQMSEGLEYRLQQHVDSAKDFEDFLHTIKSKRYTYARLRRLCLNVLLNLRAAEVQAARDQPVVHVLGFTATGREWLHLQRKTASLPIVTRVARDMIAPGGALALTQRADNLIETFSGKPQNYGRPPLMEDSLNA
ncbi:nucleotidyltransferase [Lacticaseibacillus pabuli]|uniref:tRNA(Met) cytidine acetate ligase n=1 Tax=Lacticaseibacillus pabuli TaxID=3025672 RepID=A0ABY7WWP5_9LACO|nr:nucleotidyltransferase [Lacticaseibacillus sp. KACC 23028]WDF83555.1 nucleotidyltransferase [Lacticaseibacillus sp. KACC 23028]